MKYLPVFFVTLFFLTLSSSYTLAQGRAVVEEGGSGDEKFARLSAIPILFENILAVITLLAGFAALMMLIFGGFRYITAQGDPKAVQSARGTITWAIIGLVMVVVSWLILVFLADFLGLPGLTRFCFGLRPDGSGCFN